MKFNVKVRKFNIFRGEAGALIGAFVSSDHACFHSFLMDLVKNVINSLRNTKEVIVPLILLVFLMELV